MTPSSGEDRLIANAGAETSDENAIMADRPVIQCDAVTKFYGTTRAVAEVNISLAAGEILALVGPSGGGKTTFLRLIAGFESPDSGTVTLDGRTVAGPGYWVPPEDRKLGMVFQDYALFPHMTVYRNVLFALGGWSKPARSRRVREVLEMVGLFHLAGRYPHQLSGGEQQRVAMARSLAPRPVALLLDEPFSNLDLQLRLRLRGQLKGILRAGNVTSVYVTHDQEEALVMGDKVALMNGGRVEQVGTPEEMFHSPRTRYVAEFMGVADFVSGTITEDGLVTEIGTLRPQVSLSPGTPVEVLLRPDDVLLKASSSGTGRVLRRIFRGMHYLYALSLPSGATVHSLQHHSTSRYREAENVEVYLEPDQTLTCFVTAGSEAKNEGSSFAAVTEEKLD